MTIKIMIKEIMKILKKLEKVIIKYLIVFKHLGKLSWFFVKVLWKGSWNLQTSLLLSMKISDCSDFWLKEAVSVIDF